MVVDNIFYVYVLLREDGRTPFYIGKGTGNRWNKHQESSKDENPTRHTSRIIKKIREQGKEYFRIKIKSKLTEHQAFELEKLLISSYKREIDGGPLVNLTEGGEGSFGVLVSEDTRAKHRERKGEKHPLYGRRGKNNPLFGKSHSENSIKNMRTGKRKYQKYGKDHHAFGKPKSENTRVKISISQKGIEKGPLSLVTREKMKISQQIRRQREKNG